MAAAKRSPMPRPACPAAVRIFSMALLLAASAVAGYLGWVSWTGADAVGCGPESGCATVLNSRWSYWMGVPVSLPGLLTYLVMLGGWILVSPRSSPERQRLGWTLLLLTSFLILGSVLWFTLLQMIVIKQFCPFCLSAHACALVPSLLVFRYVPFGLPPAKAKHKPKAASTAPAVLVSPATLQRLILPTLGGLALLIGVQMVSRKRDHAEGQLAGGIQISTNQTLASGSASLEESPAKPSTGQNIPATNEDSNRPAEAAAPQQVAPGSYRSISLFNGQVEFDVVDVPVIGNPNAPHILIELHDYTCKGCQRMHEPLKYLYRKYSNDLAIVSLPLPLDSTCNPLVPRTPQAHVNACEYARIALAVWKANPQAIAVFDDWIFAPEEPPSIDETRAYARELVGDTAFAAAWNDPWVDRQLKINIALYGLNYRVNRKSSMPQIFFGTNIIFGSLSAEELEAKVVSQFGLTPKP